MYQIRIAAEERDAAVHRAIDVVDGSVGFRRLRDEPGGHTLFSYKFELVNHSDAPVTIRSVRVSLVDASGLQLNASAWTTTMTVPPNGMLAYTNRMRIPTALADDVVAVRVGGV